MSSTVLRPTVVPRLDDAFWDAFVARHWQRGPLHLRFDTPPLALQATHFFDAVTRAAHEYRHRVAGAFLRMYVDGHMRVSDLDDVLPAVQDATLDAYADRARRALGGAEFTVILYTAQRFSVPIWRQSRAFLAPLLDRVGVPSGNAAVDAFLGRYARTPFGIHKDHAANFSLVVVGTKSMLFWPDETFRTRDPAHPGYLGRSDYETFADGAIRVDARAGDVIFWPASWWHIALSDDHTAAGDAWPATLNLGLYEELGASPRVSSAFASLLRRERRERDAVAIAPVVAPVVAPVDRAPDALPPDVARELDALRAAATTPALAARVRDEWLRYVSAGGFHDLPVVSVERIIAIGDRVVRSPGSRILWQAVDGELRVAANGSLLRCPAEPAALDLLARLARGEEIAVDGAVVGHLLPLLAALQARDAIAVASAHVDPWHAEARAPLATTVH